LESDGELVTATPVRGLDHARATRRGGILSIFPICGRLERDYAVRRQAVRAGTLDVMRAQRV